MKKYISILLAAAMLFCLTACGNAKGEAFISTGQAETLQIVATIFPEYDWIREILGSAAESAELTLLLDNGVDMHSYQPTMEAILKISACDVFVYVGGESDKWVEGALKEAVNPEMQVVNLLEVLGDSAKKEEIVEGEEEPEYDEHVWLSLKNAQLFCSAIADALSLADPENESTYRANAENYCEKLSALDAQYRAAVDNASIKTLLFADRFPFRYLVDDYGLNYYAAFDGCSAESEASFETITLLAGKVDELNLHTVLTIDNSNQKLANTIIQCTESKSQQILALDSMQSVTSADGETYLTIMESNLEILKEALM